MTREEVFEKVSEEDKHNLSLYEIAYEAMDIFAKQECIEFAKWLSHNCYDQAGAEAYFSWKIEEDEWIISINGMEKITTEQAYELYIKSKLP